MDILISSIIAILALFVFVLALGTNYKTTFDIIILLISGLIFHATSIYCAISFFGIIQ